MFNPQPFLCRSWFILCSLFLKDSVTVERDRSSCYWLWYQRHTSGEKTEWKIRQSLEGNGNPIQYSCLENPMDRGAWWAVVHWVAKSRTRLSDFTFTFHFHALEKEMATHSSVLAWRIPGMAEPGGLPSMGSHRVGHDWSDLAAAAEKKKPAHEGNTFSFDPILHTNTYTHTLTGDLKDGGTPGGKWWTEEPAEAGAGAH